MGIVTVYSNSLVLLGAISVRNWGTNCPLGADFHGI